MAGVIPKSVEEETDRFLSLLTGRSPLRLTEDAFAVRPNRYSNLRSSGRVFVEALQRFDDFEVRSEACRSSVTEDLTYLKRPCGVSETTDGMQSFSSFHGINFPIRLVCILRTKTTLHGQFISVRYCICEATPIRWYGHLPLTETAT